jgi:Phosphoesterase family
MLLIKLFCWFGQPFSYMIIHKRLSQFMIHFNLQKLPQKMNTVVVVNCDDTCGWYDHATPPIVSESNNQRYDKLYLTEGLLQKRVVLKLRNV